MFLKQEKNQNTKETHDYKPEKCTKLSLNPKNVGNKHKTAENPNQNLESWTFPSILMRILKENGYFLYFSLSNVTPSRHSPKVALFLLFVRVSGHSGVSAPYFCIAARRTLAAVRKHRFYLVAIQIVRIAARTFFAAARNFLTTAPQLGLGFFLRLFSSNSLHFSQVFILHENNKITIEDGYIFA